VLSWPMLFSARAYLGEIILLERNPMRKTSPESMTTIRRCRTLHAGQTGDLFAQWLGATMLGASLLVSFWCSVWFVGATLTNRWQWDPAMFGIYYEIALWLVLGFFGVVRFLGYLDLRIRREGWEVELVMRAEGARLAEDKDGYRESR